MLPKLTKMAYKWVSKKEAPETQSNPGVRVQTIYTSSKKAGVEWIRPIAKQQMYT